jgi:hypothetical protein
MCSKIHFVSIPDKDVSLGTTDCGNHRLACWQELLEQTRSSDVICMHVSVQAVLQAQAKVFDLLGISIGCLDNLGAKSLKNG